MKKYVLPFLISLIIYLLVIPLRGEYVTILGLMGFPLSLLVGSMFFYILTLLWLNKHSCKISSNGILFAIIMGIIILEVPFRIMFFKSSLVSLPDILFKVFAVFIAYSVFKIRHIFYKTVVSVLFFSLCFWFSYSGYYYWIHKLSYGTFTGKTELVMPMPIQSIFENDRNEYINLNDIVCEYLVLNFWTSSCGICFIKFPAVEKVYKRWNNDKIQIYSIFCRNEKREETLATGIQLLCERGYMFPSLSIDKKDPILKDMGVTGFPTVLILDKYRRIVFKGDILQAEKFLEKVL